VGVGLGVGLGVGSWVGLGVRRGVGAGVGAAVDPGGAVELGGRVESRELELGLGDWRGPAVKLGPAKARGGTGDVVVHAAARIVPRIATADRLSPRLRDSSGSRRQELVEISHGESIGHRYSTIVGHERGGAG